jgi:HTH-type transcriptional regulator/antitoxin HipB
MVFMSPILVSIDKLAQFLQQHRKIADLTQLELAELAGVGKTVIYDIEHGKMTIKLDTLLRILAALNIQCLLTSPLMKEAKT